MAEEKKRDLFLWLGFGQEEQTPEKEIEAQSEQPVVKEIVQAQEPVKAFEQAVEERPQTRIEAEAETFATDVAEVTEQVVGDEEVQPEAEVVIQPEPVAEEAPEPAAIGREELPLPEDVNAEAVSPEEWQAEAEVVEIVEAVEEEAAKEEITGEELEAALAAEAAEEAVMMVPSAEEEQPVEEVTREREESIKEGLFTRLKRSLLKTKENLGSGFINLFHGKKIDDDLLEELEEQLLITDVGMETTREVIANLTEGVSREQFCGAETLYGLLKEEMGEILAKVDEPPNAEGKTPFVILIVNIGGVGKTTTTSKLARQFKQQGKSVMLATGDTFRTTVVEQLQVWGQRNNIPVIAQHTGADSASVIFDTTQAAKAHNTDVLIADTAGRLQNKSHPMGELKGIVHVMKKFDVKALHEVVLAIDTSIEQNAVNQVKLFHEAVGLTGITLTKLDDTAKGEVIFSMADQFGIPIRYTGVGERIEDSRPFKADDFIGALLARGD